MILGSGDIGMIMARRLTIEGAKVERVLEIMPLSNRLVSKLRSVSARLWHSASDQRTVNRILARTGLKRSKPSVWISTGTPSRVGGDHPCDTLLLSVGLIPENELSKKAGVLLDPVTNDPFVDDHFMTNIPGSLQPAMWFMCMTC